MKKLLSIIGRLLETRNHTLSEYTDEELDTELKTRQFSRIQPGDRVIAFGINGPETMTVVSKSAKVAYLMSEDKRGSYHIPYLDIVCRL